MFPGFGWFGKGQTVREHAGQTLLLLEAGGSMPERLTEALERRFGVLRTLYVGSDLPPEPAGVLERLRRWKPARLVLCGMLGLPPDLWARVGVPFYWLNATTPDAEQAQGGCVRSTRDASLHTRVPVTGDPCLGLEAMPTVPPVSDFCLRFQEIRTRERWVLYVPQSEEPEEDLAYQTFLRLSRRGVGLLVLAPADPARHETVYRDAMRFHLLTNRHRRLMTSYVPHKTRVYYIEDAPALAQMYPCADVVVAGGSFATAPSRPPELLLPLALGRPTVVGPQGASLLQRAAVADGAVLQAASAEVLEQQLEPLLLRADERARQGAWGRSWLEQQCGALQRVLDCVGQW